MKRKRSKVLPSKYLLYNYRKGLTLIELSIVMAILGVLLTGIFSTMSTAIKIIKNSEPKGGTSRKNIFYALDNLTSTFSQSFYVAGHRRLIFIGKNAGVDNNRKDRVVFAANHTNAEETGSASIREVSFYLKQRALDSEYYYLIRREDEMVDANPEAGGVEHILLDYVKSFALRYSARGDKWQDDWNTADMKKLPKLIRIELIALVGDEEIRYESLAFPGLYFK